MRESILLSGALLLLTACGGGQTALAVDACAGAIQEKLADRNYRIDRSEMATKAKPEGEDVVHIQAGILFDAGLPSEYRQTFDCKTRQAEGSKQPDVIKLTFTW